MPCCESNVQARLPSFRRYEVRIRSPGYAVAMILLYLLIEESRVHLSCGSACPRTRLCQELERKDVGSRVAVVG